MASLPKFTDSNGKSYIRIAPGETRRNALPFDVTGYSELRLLVGMSLETLAGAFPVVPSTDAAIESLTPSNYTAAAMWGLASAVPFAPDSDTISIGASPGFVLHVSRPRMGSTGSNYGAYLCAGRLTTLFGKGAYLHVFRNGVTVSDDWKYGNGGNSAYQSSGLVLPADESQMAIWGLSARLSSGSLILRNLYSSKWSQTAGLIAIDQASLTAAVPTEMLPSPDLTIPDWGDVLPRFFFVRNPFVGLRLRIYLLAFVGII